MIRPAFSAVFRPSRRLCSSPGLNVLIAQKEAGGGGRRTNRNRAGRQFDRDRPFPHRCRCREGFGFPQRLSGQRNLWDRVQSGRRGNTPPSIPGKGCHSRFSRFFRRREPSDGHSIYANIIGGLFFSENKMFGLRSSSGCGRTRPNVPFALRVFRSASTERCIHHSGKTGDHAAGRGLSGCLAVSPWAGLEDCERLAAEYGIGKRH